MAGGGGAPAARRERHRARSGGQTRWQRKMCPKKARRPPPTPKGRPLIFLREEDEEAERGRGYFLNEALARGAGRRGAGAEKQRPSISQKITAVTFDRMNLVSVRPFTANIKLMRC